jgi:hypothetical protein
MMDDGETQNWPKLVPIVQGILNNRKQRGHTRTPYECVYGTTPTKGYRNNSLAPEVFRLLVIEAGIDALSTIGVLADEAAVVAAVESAQAVDMEPRADEESDSELIDAVRVSTGRRTSGAAAMPTAPVGGSEVDDAESWRVYEDPTTRNKQHVVPQFLPNKRDGPQQKVRKERHHKILESFCKRFNAHGMYDQTHKVVAYLVENNKYGARGMNMYTQQVRNEIVGALPPNAIAKSVPSSAMTSPTFIPGTQDSPVTAASPRAATSKVPSSYCNSPARTSLTLLLYAYRPNLGRKRQGKENNHVCRLKNRVRPQVTISMTSKGRPREKLTPDATLHVVVGV